MNPYLNQSGTITESPFTHKKFREALSYGFNYSAYIVDVLNGFGVPMQGPIPQGMFGHDDDLYMFEYNITKAVDYWNQSMWMGLDDKFANNSYSLTFYYESGNTQDEKACWLLKECIDDITAHPLSIKPSSPLTVNVVGLNWGSYQYQVRNRQLPAFFFDPTT